MKKRAVRAVALSALFALASCGGGDEPSRVERPPTPTARPGGESPIPPGLQEALRRAEEVPTPSAETIPPRPNLPEPAPMAGSRDASADAADLRSAAEAAMRMLVERAEMRNVTALRRDCYVERSDIVRLNENEAMVEVKLECRREVEAGVYKYETTEERGKLVKENGRWGFKG